MLFENQVLETAHKLAGDLLPNATKEPRLATAFNRLHMQNEEGGIVDAVDVEAPRRILPRMRG